MAFVEEFSGPHRMQPFMFFAKGSAVGSSIDETINIGKKWTLQELRLHFSTAMGSAKYLTLKIDGASAGLSSFDTLLLSANLNGVLDYNIYYSAPMMFASGQKLTINASAISVANQYGIQVIGWAVVD